ncbi:hypothetical protein EO93_14180 [Methanosarcina sp. 1.H.A.2.2]|nr:hypothetical protein EO93_14180 [Methanosarcina sp. 1.H.A.2.2]
MAHLPGEHFFRKTNIEKKIGIDNSLPEKIIRTENPHEMRAVRLRKRYGLIYKAEEWRKRTHVRSVCRKCGGSRELLIEKFESNSNISA